MASAWLSLRTPRHSGSAACRTGRPPKSSPAEFKIHQRERRFRVRVFGLLRIGAKCCGTEFLADGNPGRLGAQPT